ncbi:MAG: hypothetical protein ABSC13_02670 [Dehalococcoidia bacterium]
MEIKVSSKDIRLDQLTEEIRAIPGMAGLAGLSACGPSPEGETTLTIHCDEKALTLDVERAVSETVARHSPDPQWGVTKEETDLSALLARKQGSWSLSDVEAAVRALAAVITGKPADPTAAITCVQGSETQ